MKKVLLVLSLLLSLSACNFQSRAEFEKELEGKESVESDDIKAPKITYVASDSDANNKDEGQENKDDLDLVSMYGKGKAGNNMNPSDSQGNIIDKQVGESHIGVSLKPSIQSPEAFSTILSYKDSDELVEREFGPVAGKANLSSMVSYDEIQSESGPMLLVSQVTVDNGQTYSSYYLFNRYMSLMDCLVFKNSTDNIIPSVERLGEMVENPESSESGNIDQAIDRRIEIEKKYLPSLLDVYKVKSRPVTSLVEGKEKDIGYLPDITDDKRILLVKTSANPENMGMNIDIEN
ncbi:hypothetical protein [uncultured Anaerococcus sp.]|uniref:hypothetical protein n=1 Tax=uncultured Anaerococcus sp. TaxID=293428 RepID=UPI002619BDA3|nr:hypothetical protein [uncultured Anaerococcus sp.]